MFAFGSPDTAFVSPRHALYPHMTVFKNVAGDLSLRGWSAGEIKARISEMESWPWLSPIFYKACRELAEDELFLAALARALASGPAKLVCEIPEEPSPGVARALDHVKQIVSLTLTSKKTGTAWSDKI